MESYTEPSTEFSNFSFTEIPDLRNLTIGQALLFYFPLFQLFMAFVQWETGVKLHTWTLSLGLFCLTQHIKYIKYTEQPMARNHTVRGVTSKPNWL